MSDWGIRKYDAATDLNGILYLWLKSHAHSSHGRARGAHEDGSDGERAYWAEHRSVVLYCLEHGTTDVLCDPEMPSVIWAFANWRNKDVFNYAVVKRRFKDLAPDMFKALIGNRLDTPCVYTHDLHNTGISVPKCWTYNPYKVAT